MKLFNDSEEETREGKAFKGNFKEMMDERKKALPKFEKAIQNKFKDYSGEMVAIVLIKEDENGDPESSEVFVGGVSTFETSMKMLESLNEVKDAITSQMAQGLADNPGMMGELLSGLLKSAFEKESNKKDKK